MAEAIPRRKMKGIVVRRLPLTSRRPERKRLVMGVYVLVPEVHG